MVVQQKFVLLHVSEIVTYIPILVDVSYRCKLHTSFARRLSWARSRIERRFVRVPQAKNVYRFARSSAVL